ncbi:DsbA family protein [Patescibacteria group bacterium]|nr:DsbA family protein [Patescibacteria group bacterium]MBU1673161.1 DsbA family protein [Patescibacteria group bacterium]MBU1964154.1 DsbA family protein [Patescibacteria group bacterium]
MPEKNTSKTSAKVIVYISIFSFLIVLISLFYLNSINFTVFTTNSGEDVEPYQKYGDLELGYDPLVTVVPKELQDLNAKSEIFISSMDPKIGAPNASVIVTIFGNLQDSNMREVYETLENIAQANPDQMLVVWKDYVLPEENPSLAQLAAEAAHCMADQGEFWNYFGFITNNQEDYSKNFFKSAAKNQNIDYEEFEFCFDNRIMQPIVEQSYYYAGSVGVDRSPLIFINNEKVESDFSKKNLEDKIRPLIEQLKQDE